MTRIIRRPGLTVSRIREVLDFYPESGELVWIKKISANTVLGSIAGTVASGGYMQVGIDKRIYRYHHIVWFLFYGKWPASELDHINGDRKDNRVCNLRESDRSTNLANTKTPANNTSGFKGVLFCRDKKSKRWRACIGVNNKTVHLGYFDTAQSAHEAYATAAVKYFGQFARAA